MKGLEHLSASYREEAAERLTELEATLLELESRPGDTDLVDRAFRALHTIKGSGAMFGFDDIAKFTHELESAFELVRSGTLDVTPKLISLVLAGGDVVRRMLGNGTPVEEAERERVVSAVRSLRPPATGGDRATRKDEPNPTTSALCTYHLQFEPRPDVLHDGTDVLQLLAELDSLGNCEFVAHTAPLPPLEELDPEHCYVGWEGVVTTDRGSNALRDVFIFVEDRCVLQIEPLGLAKAPISTGTREEEAAGPRLAANHAPRPAPSSAASSSTPTVASSREGSANAPETSSIRVAAQKLDELVDLVGELVIAQARLTRAAASREDPELLAIAEDVERLATALRDRSLSARMVPIGSTFGRFRRLARDLSGELGKQIDLVTEGAETELDKTVIERLADPLMHLLRNACDHGIESPEARHRTGKPSQGTVQLSARHAGASVIIEVRDDGAGIDAAAVRAKAVQRGLIDAHASLSEKELFNLIFMPGFSTATQVSNVSGRGVGMDVVKRSVDTLRGTVELDSVSGRGTTVRLRLPLTLAIIEGLLVRIAGGCYVLPLALVEECVELTAEDVEQSQGARLAPVRGDLVPYLRLRDVFGVPGSRPPIEQIAITSIEGARYGVAVDEVVGQHQTVIKSLGRMHRNARGLSGATILGDGTVALIVDVPSLVRSATSSAGARDASRPTAASVILST